MADRPPSAGEVEVEVDESIEHAITPGMGDGLELGSETTADISSRNEEATEVATDGEVELGTDDELSERATSRARAGTSELDVGSFRPVWQSDEEQSSCTLCDDSFGVLTRRHHCRVCGKLVCASCSKRRVDLSRLGYFGPSRVCDRCARKSAQFSPQRPRHDGQQEHGEPLLQDNVAIWSGSGDTRVGLLPCIITDTCIKWRYKDGWSTLAIDQCAERPVLFRDVCAFSASGIKPFSVVVTSFPRFPKQKRTRRDVLFEFKSQETLEQWMGMLATFLPPDLSRSESEPPRRFVVYVNPFGGTKIAPKIWATIRPVVECGRIECDVIETTHANHAREHVRELDFSDITGVISVGGDGLLYEVVNGIMEREDRDSIIAAKVIQVVPGGSGNGLAKQFGLSDPVDAAFAVTRGECVALDLIKVEQPEAEVPPPPVYSFLSINWGIVSDVDFESERYRFMGNARFTVGAVVRLLDLRKYRGRIRYVPADETELGEPSPDRIPLNQRRFCDLKDCDVCANAQFSGVKIDEIPEHQWVTVEGELITVVGCNVAWISKDVNMAPFAHVADGCIDLVFVRANVQRGDLISWFLDIETGEYVNSREFNMPNTPFEYKKVKAFTLEALCEEGAFGIDGERVESYTKLVCSVVPSAFRFCC